MMSDPSAASSPIGTSPGSPPAPTVSIGWTTHVFFLCCLGLVCALGGWAATAKIDAVSIADGEVVPSSSIQNIQHLEGGIVREILVRENDDVITGDPLIILENTASNADLEEITARETTLRLQIARLNAESLNVEQISIPDELRQTQPNLTEEAERLFQARRLRLESELARAREAIAQRERTIDEIQARIDSGRESLRIATEQIELSESLLRDNLTTRFNHLQFEREGESLRGKLAEDRAALGRAQSALAEAQAEIGAIRSTYDADVGQRLEEARVVLQELIERRRKFEDTLGRTVLRAPMDGIVKSLYFSTVGGVIRPGEVVMELVPKDDRLVIEARLPTQDVSFVVPDQQAIIRLATQDALRFGAIEGTVRHVSPDALTTDTGQPFFQVRIATEQDYFERDGQRYGLFPGMQVTVGIHTHSRTILEYLVAPFLDGLDLALGER